MLPKIEKWLKILTFALAGTLGGIFLISAGTPECFAAKQPKHQKVKKEKPKKHKTPPRKKIKLPPNGFDGQHYALNVIYFVPAGMEPFPDYERRLSEVLIYMQEWYYQQMSDRGFGERTFGLSKSADGERVNLMLVRGKFGPEKYPYSGGAGAVISELNAWFAENPDKKFSDHSLIILPSTSGDPKKPGGVPFYGLGKNCFALDFEHLDQKYCGAGGEMGWLYTVWAGGMAHELGHGLGLPHARGRVSEDGPRGTELMGAGNSTYGAGPTFLTEASCAILDCCQVFQAQEQEKVSYEGVTRTVIRFKYKTKSGTKEKPDSEVESILVAGELPKGHHVKHIAIYYDKDEFAVNQDYDAETFMAIWNEDRTKFKATIPMSEIHPGKTDKYQIRLVPIFEDGSLARLEHNFVRGNEEDFDSSGKVWDATDKKGKSGNGKKTGGNAKNSGKSSKTTKKKTGKK